MKCTWIRLVALVACLIMTVGLALPALAEDEGITIVQRKLVDAYQDNDILPEMEKRLGFDLNYIWKPSEDYASQCSILVASGDYPDMMEYWCTNFPVEIMHMAEDGIIQPLDDLLAEYGQSILNTFHPDQFYVGEDGKTYSVPTRNCEIGADMLFIVRQDWLDNLGLEVPDTLEALYDVLVAFRDEDANGNGDPTDEIPWGHAGSGVGTCRPLDLIASAFDVLLGWNEVDGELVYYIEMPEFKDTMAYYRKLYQEGLIEAEYTILTRDTYMEKRNSDRYGVEGWWFTELDPAVSTWSSDFIASVPEADFSMINWFEGPDGVRNFTAGLSTTSAVVFSNSENAAECIQLLDFLASDEGYDLAVMGIEGVHWNEVDGRPVRNTYTDEENKRIGFNMYKWLCMPRYVPRATDAKYLAFVQNNTDAVIYQPLYLPEEMLEYWSDLNKIFSSMRDKLVTSTDIDFDAEFDAMVDMWKKNGGDAVTEGMNRVYQEKKAAE